MRFRFRISIHFAGAARRWRAEHGRRPRGKDNQKETTKTKSDAMFVSCYVLMTNPLFRFVGGGLLVRGPDNPPPAGPDGKDFVCLRLS